jgi:hypothetical protein
MHHPLSWSLENLRGCPVPNALNQTNRRKNKLTKWEETKWQRSRTTINYRSIYFSLNTHPLVSGGNLRQDWDSVGKDTWGNQSNYRCNCKMLIGVKSRNVRGTQIALAEKHWLPAWAHVLIKTEKLGIPASILYLSCSKPFSLQSPWIPERTERITSLRQGTETSHKEQRGLLGQNIPQRRTITYSDQAAPWSRSNHLMGTRLLPSSDVSDSIFFRTPLGTLRLR